MSRTPTICTAKLSRIMAIAGGTVGALRPETASILRRSTTSDGAGGRLETWTTVTAGLSARVTAQGMQPWEKMDRIEGRVISTTVWIIALPAGTDIRPADRINVSTLDRTYDVIASDGPASFEIERSVQAVIVE